MKNKKILIMLMVLIVVLASQYLALRQKYNNIKSQVKYEVTSHLSSSMGFASRIDLDKLAVGDKDSISNMLYMYEDISDLNAILTTIDYIEIALINSLIMHDYKMVLNEIISKSIQGQLTQGDISNIVVITDDIKEIYKYVNKNNDLNREKFRIELEPNLKIHQS